MSKNSYDMEDKSRNYGPEKSSSKAFPIGDQLAKSHFRCDFAEVNIRNVSNVRRPQALLERLGVENNRGVERKGIINTVSQKVPVHTLLGHVNKRPNGITNEERFECGQIITKQHIPCDFYGNADKFRNFLRKHEL